MNRLAHLIAAATLVALTASSASAAVCMNRFRPSSDGSKHEVTLLSGALTFQEAQALSAAIRRNAALPLEWVDQTGKTIAKQFGELKVVRPMPVACGDKTSGVVMTASFMNAVAPKGKMFIRFEGKTVVEFTQQND